MILCRNCLTQFARMPRMDCPICGSGNIVIEPDKATENHSGAGVIDKATERLKKKPLKIRYGGIEKL